MRRLLLVLALAPVLPLPLAAQEFDFYARGPYRPVVPRPEVVTGHAAGERHTMYAVMQRYLDTLLVTAGDRARVERWGETAEGRPIRALLISAPENLARLEEIRTQAADLADPRRTTAARAAEIAARNPVIALFQYSIHGNEAAGFEAAMQVAYQLLASEEPQTLEILKSVVLVFNPSANPDGHERFAAWYNSVAVGADHPLALEQDEPWGVTGRYNHFRFDLNRDLVAQSQPETRAMLAGAMRWHPQVYVDHHSTTPTFFFPPAALPVNENLPPQTVRWLEAFGRGNAAAFDRYGWQYYVRDVFDLFYAGYWDSWPSLQGATGMTYETDGGPAFNQRRDDGSITTFRDGIAHHFVASLATLETAARNRQQRLQDYYDFRRSAMEEARTDRMKRVVIPPGEDPRLAARMLGILLRNEVEVGRLTQPLASATAHSYVGGAVERRTFPAASWLIDLGQPQRRVAKALLEPQATLNRAFVEQELAKFRRNRRRGEDADREGYAFYDVTAWSLPLTFGLDAYWTEDAAPAALEPVRDTTPAPPAAPARAASAYVFPNDRLGAAGLALALEREGYRIAVAMRAMRAEGRTWPRGTFVVRTQRNSAGLHERVAALAPELGVAVTAVQSAFADSGAVGVGSEDVASLWAPSVILAAGDGISETSYGSAWQFLGRELGMPFTPMPLANIGRARDLDRFNVIVIPDGSAGRMRSALGEGGIARLKAWVESGGVLIGFGGAGLFAAHKDVGLSTIVEVGADSGKADTTAAGETPPLQSPTAPSPESPEEVPGAIFRGTLDRSHWLTLGYEQDRLPVFIEGSTFWKLSRGGNNVITFTRDSLLVSGFVWPGNTERLLKGTAWAVVENHGRGRVVLFLDDPLFRGFWRGTARLVTNAILVGPTR